MRSIFVSYSTNILVNVLTALVCFRFLRQLGFSVKQSVAGVLALLFCTTHLHYTQNMMENNYIMLLTLTGLSFQYEWLRTGSRRALLIGSLAFGLNLLTRLTTGLDLIAGGIFLLLVLWFENVRGRELWQRLLTYVKTALPVYAIFVLIDRCTSSTVSARCTNTYVSVFAQEQRRLNPALPANYPWEVPFHVGFLRGAVQAGEIHLPLRPAAGAHDCSGVVAWKRFRPDVGPMLITAFLLLLATSASTRDIRFGAATSPGATAMSPPPRNWSRSSPCRCCCAIARSWESWSGAGIALIVVQHRDPVGVARFLAAAGNLSDGHSRPSDVRRLPALQEHRRPLRWARCRHGDSDNDSMNYDPWDYVHIDTWNFLPFLLRRVGVAPRWAVNVMFAVWGAGLAALSWALVQLCRAWLAEEVDSRC